MTYRVFSRSKKWIRIALPLFLIVGSFLFVAFNKTIATAQHEENQQYSERTSMELAYYGYNP
jgi:hypothetical protein